ncbi:MAG: hypothetical protein Q4F60_01905 [Candidatus Saccharibacteria bacterium]|nr:hypothetical protein [Candidatus Saccharibacteria bacterium]
MKVLVIGAGRFGKALGGVLEENENTVYYYDPIVFPENSLEGGLKKAEAVLFVAPSETVKDILAKLPENLPFILASKGFWSEEKFQKFSEYSVIGGAAFAEDIINCEPRFGNEVILTASSHLCEKLFSTEYLRVEYTRDRLGISMCGSLKNIFSIYMGWKEPGKPEDELKKIFHEMEDILFENGADPGTAKLSCGMADVILTCSEESRNFQFGQLLREKGQVKKFITDNTVEGVSAICSEEFSKVCIPGTARIFKEIIKEVKNAIE